ncbi:hypothetical protein HNY73_013517 [Argiope bruennichi]|uniref:Uncharacterized protein n=1 Tax=Argiope bruennichi TaxID=94029 RepID=A0A8T0EYA8_ARGBR|nr:hypothetical protein HNY73_013517 [Argiope bruennichi]
MRRDKVRNLVTLTKEMSRQDATKESPSAPPKEFGAQTLIQMLGLKFQMPESVEVKSERSHWHQLAGLTGLISPREKKFLAYRIKKSYVEED